MTDKPCGTCLFFRKTRLYSFSDVTMECTSDLHSHLCQGYDDEWSCWEPRGEVESKP